MKRSCARASSLGLPAIAFTEHVDHTVWTVELDELTDLDPAHPVVTSADPEGRVTPPPLDTAGFLASIERCRDRFPHLRILSGVELGEPHWHEQPVHPVLAGGTFDRVIGSLHCLPDGGRFREPPGLYLRRDPDDVIRSYLNEFAQMVSGSDAFSVLGHVDYHIRSWPSSRGPFDPGIQVPTVPVQAADGASRGELRRTVRRSLR